MRLRFSVKCLLLTAGLLLPGLLALAASPVRLAEPPVLEGPIHIPLFGDDEIVNILGRLLGDPDILVREQATLNLGETHNPLALTYIRKAYANEDIRVQGTAVTAAATIGVPQAELIVLDALDSDQPALLLRALQGAAAMKLSAASEKIRGVLSHKEPRVRAAGLETLTFLVRPAQPSELKTLLSDGPAAVRLRAAENALLLKTADGILPDLMQAASAPNIPAVRAAGIETLGKFAFAQSERIFAQAAKSTNPLIRRSAVRVYHRNGKTDLLLPFLTDGSPLVRLAAVRAVGNLKARNATDTLIQIFQDVTDEQTHLAARRALRQIGTDAVAREMGKLIPSLMAKIEKTNAKPTEIQKKQEKTPAHSDERTKLLLTRNAMSCCWGLGELKSEENYDYLLQLVVKLPVESPIIEELSLALGKIGNPRAIIPLNTALKSAHRQGLSYLIAIVNRQSPPPFIADVSGKLIKALGMLKDHSAVETIVNFALTEYQGLRLPKIASYAAQTLPALVQADNRKKIEDMIVALLSEDKFGLTTQWHAARSAGIMEIQPALPYLQRLLTERRPSLTVMYVAGWAIQEITGQTPVIPPQPQIKQGGWIIKKIIE